jgi:hypothetical protein
LLFVDLSNFAKIVKSGIIETVINILSTSEEGHLKVYLFLSDVLVFTKVFSYFDDLGSL